MSFDQNNDFGEPLYLPTTFEHPNVGKYKDEPESFFLDKAVHIYVDVEIEGTPFLAPCWLDVVRFEDRTINGKPERVGIGRVKEKQILTGGAPAGGEEVVFWPLEVFDVIQRLIPQEGEVYRELARVQD